MATREWRKNRGEYVSNWEERLRQISVIKERFTKCKGETETLEAAMNDFFD